MDLDQTPSLPETGADTLALVSQVAELNLLFAQQEIGRRIVDPTLPTKVLLELAEHSYKTSGMAKKQEAVDPSQNRAIIQIVLPGSGREITLGGGGETIDAEPTPATLVEEARQIINWDSVPEFSGATE